MEVLYKYMTAERVLTCLPEVGDGTLRATQPAALNDPFECAIRTNIVHRDERHLNKALARVLSGIHGATPVGARDVAQARKQYGTLYLRNLFANQLSQRFGIVSFTTNPLHPLMWSHYTFDGSGLVVGYEVNHLDGLRGRRGDLREVQYGNEMIHIIDHVVLGTPEDNLYMLMSVKSDHWEYESEWRLIIELEETIGTGHRDPADHPINLIRVPNEAVVEVYYTERTPGDVVEKVQGRLKGPNNRYGTRHLTKLVLSTDRYGYEVAP